MAKPGAFANDYRSEIAVSVVRGAGARGAVQSWFVKHTLPGPTEKWSGMACRLTARPQPHQLRNTGNREGAGERRGVTSNQIPGQTAPPENQ
jgi:hypothetical protein